MGNWKLVNHRQSQGAELYDLSKDIGESTDLAKQQPDKFKELDAAWKKWNAELVEPTWGPNVNAGNPDNAKKKNRKKKAAN